MGLIVTTPPAIEPITLGDAKRHLRFDEDLVEEDSLISLLISSAREYGEAYCNRSFITQKRQLTIDCLPGGIGFGYYSGEPYGQPPNCLILERSPVQSVDSIVYVAMDGTTQTVVAPAAPAYAIDLSGPVGRIAPGFGQIWPISLPTIGAIKINYTCGYGLTTTSVPACVRHWILMRVSTMYHNRESVAILGRGRVEALPYVDYMLDSIKVELA